MEHEELTGKIIGCSYRMYNTLGYGYLESVYENCMVLELRKLGLKVEQQFPITVFYDGMVVGTFAADLFVEDCIMTELKSIRTLHPIHEVQLVNYLKSTRTDIGLLINFGETKVEVKRKSRELPRANIPVPNPVFPVHPVEQS